MKYLTGNKTESFATAAFILAGISCLVLIFPLFSLPSPAYITGLPWKVELLSSLLLLCLLSSFYLTRPNDQFSISYDGTLRIALISLALFILWSGLSSVWSTSPLAAFHYSLSWALFVGVTFIASSFKGSSKFSLQIFALVAVVIGISSILDHATASDFASVEGSIRIRYAKFSEMLVTLLPLVWAAVVIVRKRNAKVVLMLAGISGWLAVMLSLSRGAFIAGLIGFALLFVLKLLLNPRNRIRTIRLAACWLFLTLGVQIFFTFGTSTPSTTQYISGAADPTRSTAQMRLFTWKVAGQMVRDNLLIGVGADNYGIKFNESRRRYALINPQDADLSIAEDYLVERAHNEPLQIFAELGIVGFVLIILASICFGIAAIAGLFRRRVVSPLYIGCLSGMIAFAISSCFSSFSFRAIQNGIVFSILLGLSLRYVRRSSLNSSEANSRYFFVFRNRNPIPAFGILLCLLCVFSARAGVSRYYQYLAEKTPALSECAEKLNTSITWDFDNAAAWSELSATKAAEGEFVEAAQALRKSVDKGAASTDVYSLLSDHYIAAGLPTSAAAAMSEAVSIYPRSVYARVRYAEALRISGEPDAAEEQTSIARGIDERQANGWIALVERGDLAAFNASLSSDRSAPPAELLPSGAVLRFVDKTAIKTSIK